MLPVLPFIIYANRNAEAQQRAPLEQREPAPVPVGEVLPAAVPGEVVAVVEGATEEAGIDLERIDLLLFET